MTCVRVMAIKLVYLNLNAHEIRKVAEYCVLKSFSQFKLLFRKQYVVLLRNKKHFRYIQLMNT